MSRKKGQKQYPETVKQFIRNEVAKGRSQRELSIKYGISRYRIQSWIGLRPETIIRQAAPMPKGRPKQLNTITDYKKENRRLKMEVELLRDFLSLTGKG